MGIIKSFEKSQPTTCIPSTRFTSEVNHLHTNHHYAYHKTHHYSPLRRSHEPSHRQIEAHDYHYHHNRRKASMGDKVSGAMMKLRGSLTRRPGLKAAGTRRMHGTDGRGSRRY